MTPVAASVEYLVDAFVKGDPDLEEPEFEAEGCVDTHDGEPEEDPRLGNLTQDNLKRKIGRDLRSIGDDINKEHAKVSNTHRPLTEDVKKLFRDEIKPEEDPETSWSKYRDLMDKSMKDVGLEDHNKILAAVLVSVKGLYYLGSVVQNFAKRYIAERNLDSDFKKMEQNESRPHPSLD